MEHKKIKTKSVIYTVLVLLGGFIMIYPLIWMVMSSFKENNEIFSDASSLIPSHFKFENYSNGWAGFAGISFSVFFRNSFIISIIGTIGAVFSSAVVAFGFARTRFRSRAFWFVCMLITMMLPFQIIMIPLYIELHIVGILNTFVGLILPRITSAYGIYFMRSFFTGLPKELQEAARIDGMGEFGIFWRIMLPLCKPAFLTFFIFCLTSNWNDLLYPMMMTSSSDMRTLPAGLAMFVGEGVRETGPALAGALISMLPLLVLYCVAQKYFVEGIAVSGMKG